MAHLVGLDASVADQLGWLTDAGLEPSPSWASKDLAVIVATPSA